MKRTTITGRIVDDDAVADQKMREVTADAQRVIRQKQQHKCPFCNEPTREYFAIGCPNCWEVRGRMDTFLKSKKNRAWLVVQLLGTSLNKFVEITQNKAWSGQFPVDEAEAFRAEYRKAIRFIKTGK